MTSSRQTPMPIIAAGASGTMPIGRALSFQASRDPDRPALTLGEVSYTRLQLDRAANRLARDIAARGVGVGDRVAVVLPTSPTHQITCQALWKIGATVIPLPSRAVVPELRHLLKLADPKLVIGVDRAQFAPWAVLPPDHRPDPALEDSPLPDAVAAPWKASCSGGSTGLPKLIFDRNTSTVDPLAPMPMLQMKVDDTVLHPAPAYHAGPFCQTNWGLCWGAHIVLMERFDPLQWLRLVEQHRIRWAYMVPTMMSRVLALPTEVRQSFDVSSLEVLIHMAAPCPPWVKAAWIEWLGPQAIWETYAGTEGYGGTIINGVEWLEHRGSVGRPQLPVRVQDEQGRPLPPGEIGGIFFQPFGAANPTDAEYRTYGDMGWVDKDGYLYLADRRTDLILVGGANIYPAEVEAALMEHPAIATAVVIGLPDADLGAQVHALLELRPQAAPPLAQELLGFLSQRLSRNKIPTTVEFVSDPLRDDAGKVRRSQLREERQRVDRRGYTRLR
jgi:bile acid-coenzyme A ligase